MEGEKSHKVCLRCGKLMPAEAFFCNSCGADLRAEPAPGLQGAVDPADFKGSSACGPAPGKAAVPATYPAVYPAPPPTSLGAVPAGVQPYPAPPVPPAYHPYAVIYGQRKTDDLAIISIACAVASFVILPFFAAVAAIAVGYASRERIRKSEGALEGDGLALAGILVGMFNVALIMALLLLVVVAILSS